MEYGPGVVGRGYQRPDCQDWQEAKGDRTGLSVRDAAKIEEIMAIANRYDIPVIEDAAEGWEAGMTDRFVVRSDDTGCFRSMGTR